MLYPFYIVLLHAMKMILKIFQISGGRRSICVASDRTMVRLEHRCVRYMITSAQETEVLHLPRKLISVFSEYMYVNLDSLSKKHCLKIRY